MNEETGFTCFICGHPCINRYWVPVPVAYIDGRAQLPTSTGMHCGCALQVVGAAHPDYLDSDQDAS